MLNRFAKFLLVATSLSPVLGAVAVNQFALGRPWINWAPWLVVAVLFVAICKLLLVYAARSLQKQALTFREFESNDKEVLAYLLAYLLPFLTSKNMAFEGQWLTGAYILGIIFMVIAHAGAFHFNPVMGFLGYYFYGIKNAEGVSLLLISNTELRRANTEFQVVRLAHNIYLDVGGTHA